jgi:AraC-like DNA-binding protein
MLASRDDRTASVIVLAPVIAELERVGADAEPILRAIGLQRRDLLDHERRVPEAARLQVWRMAAAASGDPYFGLHVAQRAKLGTYDVVDYATHWSSNLEDALARVARFHRLLSDAADLRAEAHPDCTSFRRSVPLSSVESHECDSFFAVLVLRARALVGRALNPRYVRFSHRSPPSAKPYREVFGVEPTFSDRTNELVFRRRDLRAKTRCADPGLAKILDRHAEELLARLPPLGDVIAELRFHVMRSLSSGRVSLIAMARRQGKSPRTLQRELAARGTNYRELVAEVQRESALALLRGRSASISELAFLVGFASTAGFHRVFKRWTGITPEQFRRDVNGAAGNSL